MIIGCVTGGRGAQDLTSSVKACVMKKAENGVQLQVASCGLFLHSIWELLHAADDV